jgi:hypothetical protein
MPTTSGGCFAPAGAGGRLAFPLPARLVLMLGLGGFFTGDLVDMKNGRGKAYTPFERIHTRATPDAKRIS